MESGISRLTSRLRQWEFFVTSFLNYILHTDQVSGIRTRFFQKLLWRTLALFLIASAVYAFLCYRGWIPLSLLQVSSFALLALDVAFGIALLKTLRDYRGRIQLFYASQVSQASPTPTVEPDEDLPVAHREILDARQLRKLEHQTLAESLDALCPPTQAESLPESLPELPPENPDADLPDPDKVTLHCSACSRVLTFPIKIAEAAKFCQYCGGELIRY